MEEKEKKEAEEKAKEKEEKERKEREGKEEKERKELEAKEEKERKNVQKVTIGAKHFIDKVEPELTNLVDDAEDLEEIAESIKGLVRLKEKQNEIQIKCQLVMEDAYEDELKEMFNVSESNIIECIKHRRRK